MLYTKGDLLLDSGQACIFKVVEDPGLLMMIYCNKDLPGESVVTQELADKILFMIANPPTALVERGLIAWPVEALYSRDNEEDAASDGEAAVQDEAASESEEAVQDGAASGGEAASQDEAASDGEAAMQDEEASGDDEDSCAGIDECCAEIENLRTATVFTTVPSDTDTDSGGLCMAGYIIPASGFVQQMSAKEDQAGCPSVKSKIAIGMKLSEALRELQEAGYAVDEFNQNRVMVNYNTGQFYFMGCDSYNVIDPAAAEDWHHALSVFLAEDPEQSSDDAQKQHGKKLFQRSYRSAKMEENQQQYVRYDNHRLPFEPLAPAQGDDSGLTAGGGPELSIDQLFGAVPLTGTMQYKKSKARKTWIAVVAAAAAVSVIAFCVFLVIKGSLNLPGDEQGDGLISTSQPTGDDSPGQPVNPSQPSEVINFSPSDGIDDNGFWEGLTALDYVELIDFRTLEIPNRIHYISEDSIQVLIDDIMSGYVDEEGMLPELTDDFVLENLSHYGWSTVEDMESEIRTYLESGVEDEIWQYVQEYLRENITVKSIPELIQSYTERSMLHYYQQAAMSEGLSLEELISIYFGYDDIDEFLDISREQLESEAAFTLIIQAIAEDVGLSVSDDEVIDYFFENYGDFDYFEFEYGMPYLKQHVLVDAVFKYIIEVAVYL